MGCEVDRQFGIDHVADYQIAGLKSAFERPL